MCSVLGHVLGMYNFTSSNLNSKLVLFVVFFFCFWINEGEHDAVTPFEMHTVSIKFLEKSLEIVLKAIILLKPSVPL